MSNDYLLLAAIDWNEVMLQECNEDYESCIIGAYLWAPYLSPSNGRNYDGNSSQDAVKQIMEPQESIKSHSIYYSRSTASCLLLWTIVFCTQNCFV